MKFTLSKCVPCLLMAALLASCTTASIKETWRSPEAPATVYRKLLVVGLSNDDNLRRTFENIFVETLRKHGVDAMPGHTLLPDLKKANRAQIQEAARQSETDGVVITRGVSKSERTNYQYGTGTLERRTVVMQESDPDSSTSAVMSVVGIAPHETDFTMANLQTNFFDAASARLVWSALSSISEAGGRGEACWKVSAVVVKAMQKDRLIEGR